MPDYLFTDGRYLCFFDAMMEHVSVIHQTKTLRKNQDSHAYANRRALELVGA